MMKIICVDNSIGIDITYLTLYKVYETDGDLIDNRETYPVMNDNGVMVNYLQSRFVRLDEYRSKKLETIGI